MHNPTDFADAPEKKNVPYYAALIIAFAILAARLWYLQIIQGEELQEKSLRQLTREYRVPAPRGILRDRNGQVLAENRPSFNMFFHPDWLPSEDRLSFLQQICREFDIDFDAAHKRMDTFGGARPFKIKTDITREELAKVETQGMSYGAKYPLEIEVESIRTYPREEMAAHLLGYCGEIDKARLEKPRYADYFPGDLVGKTGVEEQYEEFLAGQYGRKTVEVNARNAPIRVLDMREGKAGNDVILNIDADLTATAAKAMGDFAGAVVALDPRDGAVLVAHSAPSYSPEIFSRPISKDVWQELVENKKKPLINKYITGLYPPGSTFKPFTAMAGIESGAINPKDTVFCSGKWNFGGRDFRCHAKNGHGFVNLHSGLVHSCDVYFYKIGFQMGIEVLAEYGRAFGFGGETGIDIPGEKAGVMPDPKWKSTVQKARWMPGETLSASIGQGDVLVTPLQLAVGYAALANGGTVFRPQVLREIKSQGGEVVKSWTPEVMRKLNVEKRNLNLVVDALTDVVEGGTGTQARIEGITIAGKTGTSQVRAIKKVRLNITAMPYEQRDHAWFACFAPAEKPEIVVVVLAEHEGHGGAVSAPIAKTILAAYFKKKKAEEKRRQ